MEDVDGLICFRADDLGDFVVPGSTKECCDRCYALVWVAPSSQLILAKASRRPEIICLSCYSSGEKRTIVLGPGQLQEIAQVCGPDWAMDIAQAFQRPGTN